MEEQPITQDQPMVQGYPYMEERPNNTLKIRLLIGLVIILAFSAFIWLSGHGNLRVNVSDGSSTNYHYAITDAAGNTVASRDGGDSMQQTVSKGTYQVSVTSDTTSYITIVKTTGFFGTKTVEATPQPQAGRRFVGTNPGSCMYFTDRLISGQCGGPLTNLKVHVPATAQQPSYTDDLPLGNAELATTSTQVVQTPGGLLGLTVNTSGQGGYFLYTLRPDFSIGGIQPLTDLAASDSYFARQYKAGMLLYDSSLKSVWYLAGASSKPERLQLGAPQNSGLNLAGVQTASDAVTALFNDQPIGADTSTTTAQKGSSEVIVYQNGDNHHFSFNTIVSTALTCGAEKLCTVSGTSLNVYDISTGKATLLYNLSDVSDITSIGGHLFAVTSKGILSFDADSQEGTYSYTFGKYQYCGINPAPNGYLLCVVDTKGQRQALYSQFGSKNTDNVDKKVLSLLSTTGVTNVSVYNNLIFITPDYGETSYNWNTHSITYDPAKVQSVNANISSAVTKAGLNTAPFTIINLGQ